MILGPFLSKGPGRSLILPDSSLAGLGKRLQNSQNLDLFIIVYSNDNPLIAKYEAQNMKYKILENFPEINPAQIKISWFGEGEKITIRNKSFFLKHSVRFLGYEKELNDKGVNT